MNTNDTDAAVKRILIFEAEEGMILAKDVILHGGHLIATTGTKLTEDIITKIMQYNILEIMIQNKPVKKEETVPTTYFDKVRETTQYKHYEKLFNDNITSLKISLNDIVFSDNPDIDVEKMYEVFSSIIDDFNNSLQLLDMIHSMRMNDDYLFAHCINVALLSTIIGKWANFSAEDIKVLALCGLLHDIGKLLIPQEILNKPGRLSVTEYELVKTHPALGYEHIRNMDIDPRIKQACLLHHERCNGSGYPHHIKGDRIPDFAKIVTIADVYDAMTSQRVYRQAICPFTVISKIEADAFILYDPEFLIPFIKNLATSYIHNNVLLSNGKMGEVVLINQNAYSRPIIKCEDDTFIDLSKQTDISITAIL